MLGLSGCFKTPISSVGTVSRSGVANGAISKSESGGKSVSAVDSNSTTDVQLTAPAVEGLQGAGVTISPGSLGLNIDLVVEQANDFSDTSMAEEMGLAGDIQISASSPGMIIRPSENVDLKKPLTIAMPVPLNFGLNLAGGSKYAVFYKHFDPTEQKLMTGMKIVDGVSVKIHYDETAGRDTIVFEGYFGAYWATILSREVVKEEVAPPKVAVEAIMNKANVPVITSAGAIKETEVVKVQAIPELVWSKPTFIFNAASRSLTVEAVVPAGQKVEGCKVDIFESAAAKTGLSFDVPEGTKFTHQIIDAKAANYVGRFRCKDSNARITVTPWSDSIAVPAKDSAAVAANTPGVELIASGPVTITGVLNPVRALLHVSRSSKNDSNIREIPVDASGRFSLVIDRDNLDAQTLKSKIEASPIVKDTPFYELAAKVFGKPLAEVIDHISPLLDDAIRDDFLSDLEDMISNGTQSQLIVFTKNASNKVSEAQSFKFLSFATQSGNALISFSDKKLKGNVRLGEIKTSDASEIISSVITAGNLLNEDMSTIEFLARTTMSAKNIRNQHMNPVWRANGYSQFHLNVGLDTTISTHSSAASMEYKGYGFYMGRDNSAYTYSLSSICGSMPSSLFTFTPPSTVAVNSDPGPGTVGFSAFSNSMTTTFSNGGETACQGPAFYSRIDTDHNELMLQFGSGQQTLAGTIPSGLWTLTENSSPVASFDFGGFNPVATNNKAITVIPSIQMISSASVYTGAKIKFQFWDGTQYQTISDLNMVRKVISELRFELRDLSNVADHEKIAIPSSGSEIVLNFDEPISQMEAQRGVVEFSVGNHNMRFDLVAPPSGGMPLSVTSHSISSSEYDITNTWGSSGSPTGYILVRREGDFMVDFVPSNGTPYSVGFASGDNFVVYSGTSTFHIENSGLTHGASYNYKVFAHDGAYNYSPPSIGSSASIYITCGQVGNACYGHTAAESSGFAVTQSGKILEYVFNNGSYIWKERYGNRILKANGSDNWAMMLNPSGKGSTLTEFLGIASIAGRVCPPTVYIDDTNKFTSGNCLYYSNEFSSQTMDQNGSDGILGMSTPPSDLWYTGNVAACSTLGMRLPVAFETMIENTATPGGSEDNITPTFAGTFGVPSGSGPTWTATSKEGVNGWWTLDNTTSSYSISSQPNTVRCVLP